MTYAQLEDRTGPRKLLSLDGGGLRGLISLQILQRMEALLREHRKRPDLVLADEFDYIAGTSTGAIIAAGLALGKPVDDMIGLYRRLGPVLFEKRMLVMRYWSKYKDGPLKEALQDEFGADTTFGDDRLRTLLLCVLHNSSTDSPWPLSNCTRAKYNDRARPDCNLDVPLWKVVRASTAAPLFFPPETVTLGPRTFVFQDGGITPYNNPAFILYVMATAHPYGLGWAEGADNMLIVSVGTGASAATRPGLERNDVNVLSNARHIVSFLMNSASAEQDRLCRFMGACRFGAALDREVGDLMNVERREPARFSYVRYNADISQGGLDAIGLGNISSADVRALDAVGSLDELERIGVAASTDVSLDHFAGFLTAR